MRTTNRISIALLALASSAAYAQTFYGLTEENRLISFEANNPTQLMSNQAITGLADPNELILSIDMRPRTGELYGVSSGNRLYTIDRMTGAATAVGDQFSSPLDGIEFDIDFNPVVDRIRLVSSTGQNLRLNPITGQIAATDGRLAYADGDANAGRRPNIVGAAYVENFDGTTRTTLYNIDSDLDILTIQNPPNDGKQVTVGSLGDNFSSLVGFDILTMGERNMAYASLTRVGDFRSGFYQIDLATGQASLIGAIGGNIEGVRDIATQPVPEPATLAALAIGAGLALRRRRRS